MSYADMDFLCNHSFMTFLSEHEQGGKAKDIYQ